jgi:hypothetical protein
MKTVFLKWFGPIRYSSCPELIDKYSKFKPDHSFYRKDTWDKFFAGFGFGYILFREHSLKIFMLELLLCIFF